MSDIFLFIDMFLPKFVRWDVNLRHAHTTSFQSAPTDINLKHGIDVLNGLNTNLFYVYVQIIFTAIFLIMDDGERSDKVRTS